MSDKPFNTGMRSQASTKDERCEDIINCANDQYKNRSIEKNCTDTYIKEKKKNKTCELEETPEKGLMKCKDEYVIGSNSSCNFTNLTLTTSSILPSSCSDDYILEPLDYDCESERIKPKSLPSNCTDLYSKNDVVCNYISL